MLPVACDAVTVSVLLIYLVAIVADGTVFLTLSEVGTLSVFGANNFEMSKLRPNSLSYRFLFFSEQCFQCVSTTAILQNA